MKRLSFILSFVAGCTDTIGFILLFGIFTAHVTGNFILIGSSIVKSEGSLLWTRLMVLPVFFIAVMATAYFLPSDKEKYAKAAKYLFIAEALLLLAFLLSGIFFGEGNGDSDLIIILIATPAIAAMAMQNTYVKALFKGMPFTTVMTGNVTQIAMDIGALLRKKKQTESFNLLSLQTFAVCGFVMGAIIAALLIKWLGFYSVLLPVCLLFFLSTQSFEEK